MSVKYLQSLAVIAFIPMAWVLLDSPITLAQLKTERRPGETDLQRKLDSLVPGLKEAISGSDSVARDAALVTAADLPPASAAGLAVPVANLIKGLPADSQILPVALKTYGKTYPDAKDIKAVLLPHTLSKQDTTRRAAAEAVASIVSAPGSTTQNLLGAPYFLAISTEALPLLGDAAKDSDVATRLFGMSGIRTIAKVLADLYGRDIRFARNDFKLDPPKPSTDRWEVLNPVLAQLDEQIPKLATAFKSEDAESRIEAARTIESVSTLRRAFSVSRPTGLNAFGSGIKDALPALIARANDPNPAVRHAVIEAIEPLEGDLAPRELLVNATKDSVAIVRWTAARVLGKLAQLKPDAAKVAAEVSGLTRLVDDTDVDVRLAALTALQQYGKAAVSAVPAVIIAASQGDIEPRVSALKTLESLGSTASVSLPTLIDGLKSSDIRLRRAAAAGLVRFGPEAKPALAELQRALTSDDPELRTAATEAILAINRKPRTREL